MSGDSEPASTEADAADAESETDTADTMRERAGENRVKLWLLLRANRLVVAGVLTVAVFVAFVAVAVVLSPSLAEKVGASDPIETLFASMITAIVTGATLVVTIGQLVLTQENGPLGDQQDRMDGTLAVRESVADLTGAPTPTDPAAFLDAILGAAAERARDLRDSVSDQGGDGSDRDALRDDVDDLAAGVTENADAVRGQLDGAEFGSFDVVFAALNFDYGPKIGRIERIAAEHDEALTDDERDLLGELKESLSLFGPGREHVKTLYFQWALIDLSRLILYAAVPALLVAGLTLAAVDAGTFPGSTLGVDHVTLVVGGAFAVTLLPFSLFVSYLLRVLTLAKRTLAIGPLVLRDSE
jgi:ABC-type multidrug transport system fused ATPase/permease subunit